MAIYVSTTFLGDGSSVNDALKQLADRKIRHLEIGSNHSTVNIDQVKFWTNNIYIIHNYFPAIGEDFVLNLASDYEEIRKRSFFFIRNTIKICKKLGIKYYTIHLGFLGETSVLKNGQIDRNFDFKFKKPSTKPNRKKVIDRTIKIIETLYQYASSNNVRLLVENEGSKTSSQFVVFDSVEELDMLKKGVGDKLKFNFNLAHATLAGIDLRKKNVFNHFYSTSEFFEVSEIDGVNDSHLPILTTKGKIGTFLKNYANLFKKSDIILEYRNIPISDLNKSYVFVKNLLNSASPIIK